MPLESHYCKICYIGIIAFEPCSFLVLLLFRYAFCSVEIWENGEQNLGNGVILFFLYSEPHTRNAMGDGRELTEKSR